MPCMNSKYNVLCVGSSLEGSSILSETSWFLIWSCLETERWNKKSLGPCNGTGYQSFHVGNSFSIRAVVLNPWVSTSLGGVTFQISCLSVIYIMIHDS